MVHMVGAICISLSMSQAVRAGYSCPKLPSTCDTDKHPKKGVLGCACSTYSPADHAFQPGKVARHSHNTREQDAVRRSSPSPRRVSGTNDGTCHVGRAWPALRQLRAADTLPRQHSTIQHSSRSPSRRAEQARFYQQIISYSTRPVLLVTTATTSALPSFTFKHGNSALIVSVHSLTRNHGSTRQHVQQIRLGR